MTTNDLKIFDAYTRELHVGDQVHVDTPMAIRWTITEIKPVEQPGAPPEAVEIVLVARNPCIGAAGRPLQSIVRIRAAEEDQDGPKIAMPPRPGLVRPS